MEEAKHAEFFMRWHKEVVGVLEPEEVAQHFLVRGKTIDPSGRFEVRDVLHEALPYYGRRLLETTLAGTEAEIEAINDAHRKADEAMQKQMGGMMGGLKIPGLF